MIAVRHTCYLLLGVVATVFLVLSNRFVLNSVGRGPFSASGLAFAHNLCTFAVIRRPSSTVAPATATIPKYVFPLVSLLSTFSLLTSNILLSAGGVSLHQLARVLSMPVGAILDIIFDGKRRSNLEYVLICTIFCCASMTLKELDVVSLVLSLLLCAFIATYLATALAIRCIARTYEISSDTILVHILPYTIAISGFICVLTLAVELRASWPVVTPLFASVLFVNCCLAVIVQHSSTWTMKHSSLVLYATLGQVKTALTIVLAVHIFGEKVTSRAWLSVTGIIIFGCTLALVENSLASEDVCKDNRLL